MTGVSGSEKSHSDKCKGQRWHERARETQRDIERVREKHMQASRTGQVHASIGGAVLTNSSFVSACSRAILKRRVATSCTESMLDAN